MNCKILGHLAPPTLAWKISQAWSSPGLGRVVRQICVDTFRRPHSSLPNGDTRSKQSSKAETVRQRLEDTAITVYANVTPGPGKVVGQTHVDIKRLADMATAIQTYIIVGPGRAVTQSWKGLKCMGQTCQCKGHDRGQASQPREEIYIVTGQSARKKPLPS